MQAVTPDQIDNIFSSMQEYQKANFGLKNGKDFPLIAKALLESEKLRGTLEVASLMGMLSVLIMPKEKSSMSKEEAQKLLSESPLRDVLADVFFAGYKLGHASLEVGQLEALAT